MPTQKSDFPPGVKLPSSKPKNVHSLEAAGGVAPRLLPVTRNLQGETKRSIKITTGGEKY
jgi:hypothetical protein